MRDLVLLVFLLLLMAVASTTSTVAASTMAASTITAPTVAGLWQTPNRGAVVSILPCEDGFCGYIVGLFLDRPDDRMPIDYRGVTQCDLPLIIGARQIRPNLWKGRIIDPRNGSIYGVEMHLDPNGNLALRGFLGIPLLGHTQTWTRYPYKPPPDCRIGPARPVASTLLDRR